MDEIPERWKEELSQDGDTLLRQCAEELATAEARVRELEQERDAQQAQIQYEISRGLNLSSQLAAVTLERDDLSYELGDFKSENESYREECVPLRNTVAHLQEQLQAVTQERDTLKKARITCDHCTDGFNGRHEVFCQIYAYAETIAQLQAHNKTLRDALQELRNEARGFVGMANRDTHGNTNIAVMYGKIEQADAALSHTSEAKS